ncbi:MAG: host-nuclease inhibitor Gam family protein [Chitinophagaceae bacterium]|nr:host-nuclease inhibitor Gam family protein [Chitinophagaceae bacterium]
MRQKKKIITSVTQLEAEQALAEFSQTIARLQTLEGKMNSELTSIRSKYESQIQSLQAQKEEAFEKLHVFALEHPELFENKRSIEWTMGRFGFRMGTPKLKTRTGYKWPAVLELVEQKAPEYIRIKKEIDKEALIANREHLNLKELGVEVSQEDTFYVEPALDVVSM